MQKSIVLRLQCGLLLLGGAGLLGFNANAGEPFQGGFFSPADREIGREMGRQIGIQVGRNAGSLPNNRGDDPRIRANGEIEFEVGNQRMRFGSKSRWDGRNHKELEERIYRLERVVQFLMENEGYHSRNRRSEWECSLNTPFDGVYYGRGETEMHARQIAVDQCKRSVDVFYCKVDRTKCSEIK